MNGDICAAHALSFGRFSQETGHKKSTILVKFLRSRDKFSVLRERKKLKGSEVSVHEDLTKKNLMLLQRVKNDPTVEDAWYSGMSVWGKRNGHRFKVGLYQSVNDATAAAADRGHDHPDHGRDRRVWPGAFPSSPRPGNAADRPRHSTTSPDRA